MRKIRSIRVIPFASLLLAASQLFAQSKDHAADEAAIRQAGQDYFAAADRADSKALADMWTAEGVYTDESGQTTKARDLFAKNASAAPAIRPAMRLSDVAIRFVTDDVAMEDGDCEDANSDGSPTIKGHYTSLWVRQNGKWKLDSLRETRSAPAPAAAPSLESLDIFAGQWSGQHEQSTIRVNAKWDANKKFLHREFTIAAGKSTTGGAQEIGWDPLTGHIKSWSFFEDGSYGTGLWSLEGHVWMVLSTRVYPDGKVANSTQVYKFP